MGKLGTATPDATAVMADLAPQGGAVNGPEDPLTGTPWTGGARRRTYGGCGSGSSRRRRRATCKQVRNLQKLMLRSRSNTLVSVRRVTQATPAAGRPGSTGRSR